MRPERYHDRSPSVRVPHFIAIEVHGRSACPHKVDSSRNSSEQPDTTHASTSITSLNTVHSLNRHTPSTSVETPDAFHVVNRSVHSLLVAVGHPLSARYSVARAAVKFHASRGAIHLHHCCRKSVICPHVLYVIILHCPWRVRHLAPMLDQAHTCQVTRPCGAFVITITQSSLPPFVKCGHGFGCHSSPFVTQLRLSPSPFILGLTFCSPSLHQQSLDPQSLRNLASLLPREPCLLHITTCTLIAI